MMTKKREMAEWILDFFRRLNSNTGEIVMMRSVQNKLTELNPKERDLFVPVANELIENGYFVYEEGPLQTLRLTEKGREYIYDPSAELDCCYDSKYSSTQTKYIESCYNNFVAYVAQMKGLVTGLMTFPGVSDEDKKGLLHCLGVLESEDVFEVEKSLREGHVSKEVLRKIEKMNKDLVDVAVEYLRTDIVMKEFWKRMAYFKIEQEKKNEEMRLQALHIN